jgi:hypothetical protein
MTALEELRALYEQWRLLTEEEGDAIEAGDWTRLHQSQAGKTRLQPRIDEVSRRVDAGVAAAEFRPIVARLMDLERRNQARLKSRQQDAQAEKRELDRSSRHLRQLHQTYVPPARAHWQSYS